MDKKYVILSWVEQYSRKTIQEMSPNWTTNIYFKNSKVIHSAIKTLYDLCQPVNITTVQAQIMAMGEDQNCVTETFLSAARCNDYAPVLYLSKSLKNHQQEKS